MTDIDTLKAIFDFGSFGLVAWLFFHTFTKLIPSLHDRLDRIVDRFEKATDQQHKECMEIMERQQAKFDDMLAEYRFFSRQEIANLAQVYERPKKDSGTLK